MAKRKLSKEELAVIRASRNEQRKLNRKLSAKNKADNNWRERAKTGR